LCIPPQLALDLIGHKHALAAALSNPTRNHHQTTCDWFWIAALCQLPCLVIHQIRQICRALVSVGLPSLGAHGRERHRDKGHTRRQGPS